jgi:hypothetical protein
MARTVEQELEVGDTVEVSINRNAELATIKSIRIDCQGNPLIDLELYDHARYYVCRFNEVKKS